MKQIEPMVDELSLPDAISGVILCGVASDGAVHEDDLATVARALARTRVLGDRTPAALRDRLLEMHALGSRDGTDALLARSAEAIPDRLRATVFAIAADLLFSAGELSGPQGAFLERAQASLGVPHDTAGVLMQAMEVKHRD